MNNLPKRQRGLTLISWVFVIAIGLFFATIAVKMVPSYLEYYSVVEVLESLKAEYKGRDDLSPRSIKGSVMKKLDVNGVYNFDMKNLTITREKKGTVVTAEYEVRKSVAANVYVVMHFKKSVEL